MKHLLPALALVCAPAAAHAQTFTFKSVGKPIDEVILPAASPDGRPSGAQVFSVASETIFADGKKTQTTGKCSDWLLPPGSRFDSDGVCTFGDASGALYTLSFTCEAAANDTMNCWAKLVGVGGPWKGRTGLAAYQYKPTGSEGVGRWND